MVISLDIIISSIISAVAVIVAFVSLLEGRKRTKLLEVMIKTLPYTTKRKREKRTSNMKLNTDTDLSKARSDDIKRMELELEKEKLQWQKNKDIAKGLAWIIDHLGSDDEDDDQDW
ncbi:MAG: hypothetical protein LVQ96_06690 [Thermoplasmatales archaeon]|nr:hypothetical protein [Thermoplasmatales archaeon]